VTRRHKALNHEFPADSFAEAKTFIGGKKKEGRKHGKKEEGKENTRGALARSRRNCRNRRTWQSRGDVPDDRSKKINFYERACILRYTSPSGSDETRRRRRSLEIKSEESAFTTKTAAFVAKMTLTAPRLSNTSNVQCVGVTLETTRDVARCKIFQRSD